MLNKDVFYSQMEKLISVYPTWGIKCEEPKVMKIWYEMFERFSDYRFEKAVNNYIQKEKFNPNVATLIEYLDKTRDPVELEFIQVQR